MVRKTLLHHGWIACDECGKMRPRWWAYRHDWWCGGIAGHWDWCPKHRHLVHRHKVALDDSLGEPGTVYIFEAESNG